MNFKDACITVAGYVKWAVIFLLLPSICMFEESAHASDTERFDEFITTYLNSAIPDQGKGIVKPKILNGIGYSIHCLASNTNSCANNFNWINDSIIQNDRVHLVLAEQPLIEFYFGSTNEISYSWRTSVQVGTEFSFEDFDDPECLLAYSIIDNAITNAKIFVSLEQEPRKTVMCISTRFFQALGLSLMNHSNFRSNWEAPAFGYRDMPRNQLDAIRQGFAIFEYVHLCNSVLPGSNFLSVKSILTPDSDCLAELKGF